MEIGRSWIRDDFGDLNCLFLILVYVLRVKVREKYNVL